MRNRFMYYATGLPGWMRFGYSPGWVGRSATGLGPCASYMMTGQWPTPQAQAYWQAMQTGQWPVSPPAFTGAPFPGFGPGFSKEQELEFLREQADMLKQQMDQISSRIDELEQEDSDG